MPLIVPLDELIESNMTHGIRAKARQAVLAKAIELNIGTERSIVIREAVMGDVTDGNVTDWKDVESFTTAQTAGMENWAEDTVDVNTCKGLQPVIKGGGTTSGNVENKCVIGVYGFFDNTEVPDLTSIRFKRGSNTLDFWEVEQCYVNPFGRNGGMINGVVIWEENDPLQVDMNFHNEGDKFVGLHMIIAERYDQHISSPSA